MTNPQVHRLLPIITIAGCAMVGCGEKVADRGAAENDGPPPRLSKDKLQEPPSAWIQPDNPAVANEPAKGNTRGGKSEKGLTENELLQAIDGLFTRRPATPTANALKAEKLQEQFLASLNSFRGKPINLSLRVGYVTKTHVHLSSLTLDPKYNEKAEANTARELSGRKPIPIPPSPNIIFDFSGADRGESHYRHPDHSDYPRGVPPVELGRLSNGLVGNLAAEQLDHDDIVGVQGTIASVTTYSPAHMTWLTQQPLVLVSVKVSGTTSSTRKR